MFFGGAGGASGSHNGGGRDGAAGGIGGGIIRVKANRIDVGGSVDASGGKGEDGYQPPSQCISGGSGGAGGTVWLAAPTLNNTGSVTATGGGGGAAGAGTCSSGCTVGSSGGVGRVRFDYTTKSGNESNPASNRGTL